MGVSVVLAVKNEGNNLKRCLESVKWADEVIIVDNGSTDKTVSIAKRYTKNIYSYKERALIPKIQQFGIEKATKEWVLVLDADVVVPKKTAQEIQEKIKNKDINAYIIDHPLFFFNKPTKSKCWRFPTVKLFLKGCGYYDASRPHCTLQVKGKIGKIKNPLYHHSYPNISTFIRKMDLYTTQDALLLFEGKRAGLLNKKIKKINTYNLIIEPVLLFFYYFVKGRGYKDGKNGFILSSLFSYYLFIERVKVYKLYHHKRINRASQ